jgi:hypothetical protein
MKYLLYFKKSNWEKKKMFHNLETTMELPITMFLQNHDFISIFQKGNTKNLAKYVF